MNKESQSKVIYCFDCDEYDCKPEDKKFLNEAEQYCKEKSYDFIWFCKDIECVYLGDKVENHQKRDKAAGFKAHKGIKKIDEKKLTRKEYRINTSNIMNVIDQYLTRKSL